MKTFSYRVEESFMIAEKAFFLNELYQYTLKQIKETKNDGLNKYLNS